jgi:hypothetical protein
MALLIGSLQNTAWRRKMPLTRQLRPFPVVKTVEEARAILMAGGGCAVDMTGLPDEEVNRRLDELEKIGFGARRRSAVIKTTNETT